MPSPEAVAQLQALNQRIFDAGLKTQNYDKGFDPFVRKYTKDEEVAAACAVIKGVRQDHGCAVYFTQEKRRCLLLDTTYGLTDDEALWATLASWARFLMSLAKTTFVLVNVGERMSGTQPICGKPWIQKDRRTTATSTILPNTGESREGVALAGISDVLRRRHVLESNPNYKRPALKVVIYPDFLSRLGLVLTTANLGMDPQEELWPVYQSILNLRGP
jgi:hypothetical protein